MTTPDMRISFASKELDELLVTAEKNPKRREIVRSALVDMLLEENARLRAENEALRADAERYRWLRAGWDDVNSPVDFIICNSFAHTLDADIDAALAATGDA